MQQELVRMVAEKTGLSEDKARTAVDTVIGFLKGKLPAPLASQLDGAIRGGAAGGGAAGGLGSLVSGLGGRE